MTKRRQKSLRVLRAERRAQKSAADDWRSPGFERAWHALGNRIDREAIPGEGEPPTYGAEAENYLKVFGDAEPLAAFFLLIDRGYYPPPDVLLILLESWREYTESRGKKSLEECFFGPVVPRSGNYAARLHGRLRKLAIAFDVTYRVEKQRISIDEAAQQVVDEHTDLGIDSETAAKYTRQVQWPRLKAALTFQRARVRKNKRSKNPR